MKFRKWLNEKFPAFSTMFSKKRKFTRVVYYEKVLFWAIIAWGLIWFLYAISL